MKSGKIRIVLIALLVLAVLALALILPVLNKNGEAPGKEPGTGPAVLLDGHELTETVVHPGAGNGLRVQVALQDRVCADLPFGEEHLLEVRQDAGWNRIRVTKDAVYMEEADCQGQDCVKMIPVTRDNMETRVFMNLIVCLPHRLTVQVTEQN